MLEFMVMEKKLDGTWKGFGSHKFRVAARTGDYIEMNDDAGIGQTYEVIAAFHSLQPATTAGDLVIRYLDTSTNFRKSL